MTHHLLLGITVQESHVLEIKCSIPDSKRRRTGHISKTMWFKNLIERLLHLTPLLGEVVNVRSEEQKVVFKSIHKSNHQHNITCRQYALSTEMDRKKHHARGKDSLNEAVERERDFAKTPIAQSRNPSRFNGVSEPL